MKRPTRLSLLSVISLTLLLTLAASPAAAAPDIAPVSAANTQCTRVLPPLLEVGGFGMVRNNSIPIRVRAAAGGPVSVGHINTGDYFEVLEGPECVNPGDGIHYNWWKIRVPSKGDLEGWVPEASPYSRWLWPYPGDCAGAPAQQLAFGQVGKATGNGIPIRVRNAPGGSRLSYIYRGDTFDVVGGPICADPGDGIVYSWWQIRPHRQPTLIGWVPEASPYSRWLTASGIVKPDPVQVVVEFTDVIVTDVTNTATTTTIPDDAEWRVQANFTIGGDPLEATLAVAAMALDGVEWTYTLTATPVGGGADVTLGTATGPVINDELEYNALGDAPIITIPAGTLAAGDWELSGALSFSADRQSGRYHTPPATAGQP
ncbi:MAG: hypothetical protein M5R40_19170 [Anaerolineae bacterium]|nr:hypothetical protein [Anaerolineae bacterium]